MRILIFGCTGPCGMLLAREALSTLESATIVLYARSPHKIPEDLSTHQSVVIVEGTLEDPATISKAMEGVDVVLSALGPSTSPTKAPLYPSGNPLAKAYSVIIDLMHKHKIPRLIALGTPSMPDPEDKSSVKFSLLVCAIMTVTRNIYKDVVAIGETIRKDGADLDWTIVRVPLLNHNDKRDVIAGYIGDGKTGVHLSRQGFAAFVIKELQDNPQWVKKCPLISSA